MSSREWWWWWVGGKKESSRRQTIDKWHPLVYLFFLLQLILSQLQSFSFKASAISILSRLRCTELSWSSSTRIQSNPIQSKSIHSNSTQTNPECSVNVDQLKPNSGMELRSVQIVVQSWRILPSFPTSLSQRTALVGQPFREVSLEVIKVSEPTATYFNSLFKETNSRDARKMRRRVEAGSLGACCCDFD